VSGTSALERYIITSPRTINKIMSSIDEIISSDFPIRAYYMLLLLGTTVKIEGSDLETRIYRMLDTLGNVKPIGEVAIRDENIVYGGKVTEIEPGKCARIRLAPKALEEGGSAVDMLVCNLGYK